MTIAGLKKWIGDRGNDVQGGFHQVNPFDGGRTYDTNSRGVAPTVGPANHRNVLQKGWNQINMLDNGRTWQDATPNNDRSIFGQMSHNGATNVAGDYFFKPIGGTVQKSVNTIGSLSLIHI